MSLRRNRNWMVWAGFGVALLAAFSYAPFFARFPFTRDFPWANLLLFLAAGCLLAIGLHRAFQQPERYRGKISGIVLGVLTLAIFGIFNYGVFVAVRDLPSPQNALLVGQRAPDFQLTAADGKPVTLSSLLPQNRAVLLIFYRGYW